MSSTIAKDVTDRLRQHIGQGEGTIQVDSAGVGISVDVEQSERYAVGVRGIQISPATPIMDVRDAADRVVQGVDALDDPLTVVEYDSRSDRAVVRSATPDTDEIGVTYWEADVQADGTSLHRYHKAHAAPDREIVTEPLPHSTAGRVAEQLADAVKQ